MLEALFRSRVLVKILGFFAKNPDAEAYLREISREVDEPASAVRRELDRLTELGLLQTKMQGNHKYFRLKEGLPILADLKGLYLKTDGAVDFLRTSLHGFDGIQLAFVYGEFAEKQDVVTPEINMAIIGSTNKDKLDKAIRNMGSKLGRKINCVHYEPDEFRQMLEEKNPSLGAMLSGEKLVLVANISEKH